MKLKDTLLIPKTNFDMRASLNKKEPAILSKWQKDNIIGQLIQNADKKPLFVLHDGPPYANGNIHVGHALNKIVKDFMVRHKTYSGFYAPFILGWDTHGLPIENAVEKTGINIKKVGKLNFRQECSKYACKQIENQKKQFSELGLLTDFNNNYVTMDYNYELTQINMFLNMVKKNLVYRHLKPIYWSPSSKTALAEAEIEYANIKSPSIYLKFTLPTNSRFPDDTHLLVWTTTPWTIPSNQLLAIGRDVEYGLYKFNNEHYIVAKCLSTAITMKNSDENPLFIRDVEHNELLGINTAHPLYNRSSKIVYGHHVSADAGTGIVHIAGGFGVDDYQIALENDLEAFCPINNNGEFTKEVHDKELEGLFYDDTNKIICNRLDANNKLLNLKFITHSYPMDWRTKKPVIYRATNQWFVSIEKIKNKLMGAIEDIEWKPSWAKERMSKMISNRNDWCISRQRNWGVPIIAFYDENDNPILDSELIEHVISIFNKHKSTDIWFTETADFFLPKHLQNKGYTKEHDIMDVWFDSGISHLYLRNYKLKTDIIDIYFEGSDQFRGWFNSSLITSVIQNDKAHVKKVVAHGFVNDEKNQKMSKSIGNVFPPQKITSELGADILRLWASSCNFEEDVRIGDNIIKQSSESYRKIRNTLRFILGNITDFNINSLNDITLESVDRYILWKTEDFKKEVITCYDNMEFVKAFNIIINFVTKELSSFYLDFIKDILYVDEAESLRRLQVQKTLYIIYRHLIDVLKPILVFTTEEAHDHIDYPDKKSSVHLEEYFTYTNTITEEEINTWNKALEIIGDVHKAIEVARNDGVIKKSLEAHLQINLKESHAVVANINNFHSIVITSGAEFVNNKIGIEFTNSYIEVQKFQGSKCERCWVYYKKLTPEHLCKRCDILIKKLERSAVNEV